MDNTYGHAEAQARLLVAMIDFDAICRAHGIHYTLHGGTLLGAVRSHQFIPWDDDADVSMLYSEFVKLKQVLASMGDQTDYYIEHETNWVPHVIKKGTNPPVYIDILLWDYISEKKAARWLKVTLLRAVQGMMKEKKFLRLQRFSGKDKFLSWAMYTVGRLFPMKTKQKLYTFIGTRMFRGKKRFMHRYADNFKSLMDIYGGDYMSEYEDMDFEGHPFMVNTRYEQFLIAAYGPDYLTPPPEAERHQTHERAQERIMRE